MPDQTFSGHGIAPNLLIMLERMKFTTPTPIQHKAIPIAIEGKDIIGIAQTGTGKTLAFALPMIQRLSNMRGRGLIIVPTRELALQVEETFIKFRSIIGHTTAVLIGGASMSNQIRMLRQNPRIVIATPGRLIDHMSQRTVHLDNVKILVLDEADRMLDMGFAPQIARVLQGVPSDRQTMLFSATMPQAIMHLASSYMKLPVSIEIARSGTAAEKVSQEIFIVRQEDRSLLLGKILNQYHDSILIFTRTKYGASKLLRVIKDMGHSAAETHSNRSFAQRREALDGFKSGKYRILVATDIASRGIDVEGIQVVINFDLPEDPGNYVHRIGRTARAGHEGRAISFAMPDQRGNIRDIEDLIRTELIISKHPDVPSADFYGGHKPKSHPTGFAYRGMRKTSVRRHGKRR